MADPIPRAEDAHRQEDPFAAICRKYSLAHRDVFLQEIRSFIRGANNTRDELAEIRKAAQARRQSLRGNRKRGRPRGSKTAISAIVQTARIEEPESALIDPHLGFRSYCMIAGDNTHLRPEFLKQILFFLASADKQELAAIRKTVAKRTTLMAKRRGRPGVSDDDELLYQARVVAWMRIIEGKSAEQIATKLHEKGIWKVGVIPPTYNTDRLEIKPGNIQTVRGRLWRLENYLAARIWDATPSSYVVRDGESSSDLRLNALEHKPLQQLIWIETGLPFRERPDECRRIVRELWPRGQHASWKLSERKISYLLKKKRV